MATVASSRVTELSKRPASRSVGERCAVAPANHIAVCTIETRRFCQEVIAAGRIRQCYEESLRLIVVWSMPRNEKSDGYIF